MYIIKEFFDFIYEWSKNEPFYDILNQEKKLAIFLFGSPASGKSTFLNKYLAQKIKNFKIFNPDELNIEISKHFKINQLADLNYISPEKWLNLKKFLKHKFMIDISNFYEKQLKYGKNNNYNIATDKLLNSWISSYIKTGQNFIYDTSGNDFNKIKTYVEKAKENGYKIIFIKIRKELYSTIIRNMKRDRSVDLIYQLNSYLKTQSNNKLFKELEPDLFYIVFNNDNKYKFYKISNNKLLKKKGHRWV